MYPFLRLIKEVFKFRKAPQLGFGDVHISHHMCMPWDLDPWVELNNGRTLTLYDLGRIPLAARSGLLNVLKERRWGMTMAGACVRYRRRIRMFERIEIRSRALCWDDRFIYIEQSMWKPTATAQVTSFIAVHLLGTMALFHQIAFGQH